jgi:hypothetical protein
MRSSPTRNGAGGTSPSRWPPRSVAPSPGSPTAGACSCPRPRARRPRGPAVATTCCASPAGWPATGTAGWCPRSPSPAARGTPWASTPPPGPPTSPPTCGSARRRSPTSRRATGRSCSSTTCSPPARPRPPRPPRWRPRAWRWTWCWSSPRSGRHGRACPAGSWRTRRPRPPGGPLVRSGRTIPHKAVPARAAFVRTWRSLDPAPAPSTPSGHPRESVPCPISPVRPTDRRRERRTATPRVPGRRVRPRTGLHHRGHGPRGRTRPGVAPTSLGS